MSIQLPILKIKSIIESLIKYVGTDLTTCIDNGLEEESFLFQLLDGNNLDGYDFYTEAKSVFLRTDEDVNRLSVRLEYPRDISNFPFVWIREPSKTKGQTNAIGKTSYEQETLTDGSIRKYFRNGVSSNYEIVLMTQNPIESIMLGEIIHSLLMASYDLFASNFNLYEFEMRELIFNNDNFPNFMLVNRAITMNIDFDNEIPSITREEFVNKINFKAIVKSK